MITEQSETVMLAVKIPRSLLVELKTKAAQECDVFRKVIARVLAKGLEAEQPPIIETDPNQ